MRKNRKRRKRKKGQASPELASSWLEPDGLHALVAGVDPSPEALEELMVSDQLSKKR